MGAIDPMRFVLKDKTCVHRPVPWQTNQPDQLHSGTVAQNPVKGQMFPSSPLEDPMDMRVPLMEPPAPAAPGTSSSRTARWWARGVQGSVTAPWACMLIQEFCSPAGVRGKSEGSGLRAGDPSTACVHHPASPAFRWTPICTSCSQFLLGRALQPMGTSGLSSAAWPKLQPPFSPSLSGEP